MTTARTITETIDASVLAFRKEGGLITDVTGTYRIVEVTNVRKRPDLSGHKVTISMAVLRVR